MVITDNEKIVSGVILQSLFVGGNVAMQFIARPSLLEIADPVIRLKIWSVMFDKAAPIFGGLLISSFAIYTQAAYTTTSTVQKRKELLYIAAGLNASAALFTILYIIPKQVTPLKALEGNVTAATTNSGPMIAEWWQSNAIRMSLVAAGGIAGVATLFNLL